MGLDFLVFPVRQLAEVSLGLEHCIDHVRGSHIRIFGLQLGLKEGGLHIYIQFYYIIGAYGEESLYIYTVIPYIVK